MDKAKVRLFARKSPFANRKMQEAGLNIIRTWGFRDLNVTFIPDGLPKYGGEGAGPSTIYFQSWDNGIPTISAFTHQPQGI